MSVCFARRLPDRLPGGCPAVARLVARWLPGGCLQLYTFTHVCMCMYVLMSEFARGCMCLFVRPDVHTIVGDFEDMSCGPEVSNSLAKSHSYLEARWHVRLDADVPGLRPHLVSLHTWPTEADASQPRASAVSGLQ